jgi:hypothetical protein
MSVDYEKIFAEYTEPRAPGAVLRRVSDIERQELQWLWPARIPLAKLTLFAGDPGLGKSFVTLDIAARVTRGTKWPDGATATCKSGSVIILSAEDDPGDTIRPRLEAAGADLSKVHVLQAVWRAKSSGETSLEHFSLETDLLALQDAVVSLSDALLIVIDPVSAYLGGIDSHVNAKVRSLLAPLSQMAATTGVAVVTVTHLNKNSSSALYRASGSVAFVAAARAVWLFAKNPDDPAQRLMLPGKMNLAPEQSGMGYQLEAKQDVVVVTWGEAVTSRRMPFLSRRVPSAARNASRRWTGFEGSLRMALSRSEKLKPMLRGRASLGRLCGGQKMRLESRSRKPVFRAYRSGGLKMLTPKMLTPKMLTPKMLTP